MAKRAVAVITGASSGIGVELARLFAANGHELVLVARSEAPMNALAESIAATGKSRPHVLPIDLALADAGDRLADGLERLGAEPTFVVNNAGFGLLGMAASLDRAEQLSMIDLNVRTLTDLSLRFLPSLTAHRGGLLNVASVAGFLPGPGQNVYYATKAYVLSFTEALAEELAGTGVRVCALCPGPVPTGFQARAGVKRERKIGMLTLSAERVAREGYDGFMAGKRLVVPGFGNKLVTLMPRLLPRSLVTKLTDARKRRLDGEV
ncbi:sulfoacetaldehyde reductase [Variibacter gotjawalensis]|uniref:Sulfoacetaldehyde reductase n=1 Tax=Variibacter gotjawalensis TaxID=1333996 RepID=A0A0S3PPG9_9BRAD|nr:SDR family oxidoreductase [Variibacter gotjawalensis]NIK48125.1 hypothetical protein [Variibacter gotjawalensis]RZS50001.1 hypothetical protein EV661_2449 [Variibacter gotjawalensis]BAT57828.1 sulfoacetaldehyde reductase [Variibacter gotjawalensis]